MKALIVIAEIAMPIALGFLCYYLWTLYKAQQTAHHATPAHAHGPHGVHAHNEHGHDEHAHDEHGHDGHEHGHDEHAHHHPENPKLEWWKILIILPAAIGSVVMVTISPNFWHVILLVCFSAFFIGMSIWALQKQPKHVGVWVHGGRHWTNEEMLIGSGLATMVITAVVCVVCVMLGAVPDIASDVMSRPISLEWMFHTGWLNIVIGVAILIAILYFSVPYLLEQARTLKNTKKESNKNEHNGGNAHTPKSSTPPTNGYKVKW